MMDSAVASAVSPRRDCVVSLNTGAPWLPVLKVPLLSAPSTP